MKHPSSWSTADLHHHLQHAIDLELWTVPLYLTALYSIRGLKGIKPHNYPVSAKLIYSVVVQEMLHVELVCNLSNALGWSPQFHAPSYTGSIPFIHPAQEYLPEILKGYTVEPQALNENSLRLFCAIELPHPKKELIYENEKSYNSIADLYEALKIGVAALWDECYIGHERNTKQKNSFREYPNMDRHHHGFSQPVTSPDTAIKAIEAIIEQGEGADSMIVPADYQPPEHSIDKEHDAGWFKGHLSHYQKFRILLHHHHLLPPVYEERFGCINTDTQNTMEKAFGELLSEMENTFNNDGDEMSNLFWSKMYSFANCLIDVWESGACPRFDSLK
jgi:hypothetical protein